MSNRPGGALAKRPLHFFWLLDCSSSMKGRKVDELNKALVESIEPMRRVANANPTVDVFVRVLCFSSGTFWAVAEPTHIDAFTWEGIDAEGVTDTGEAFRELAKKLAIGTMPERGLPPVIVLLTDGLATDDVHGGLRTLLATPWAVKAVRVAIAMGEGCDTSTLAAFTGDAEFVIKVGNVHQLTSMIRWASTIPLDAASKPATGVASTGQAKSVHLPTPVIEQPRIVKADEVF